mmetsp:Transcript_22851/g.35767  ORF Transcript_22851/g.35767 Transcript_22851/m.35767 type:complete len:107 (+) Transcript_22851:100-420(+)
MAMNRDLSMPASSETSSDISGISPMLIGKWTTSPAKGRESWSLLKGSDDLDLGQSMPSLAGSRFLLSAVLTCCEPLKLRLRSERDSVDLLSAGSRGLNSQNHMMMP